MLQLLLTKFMIKTDKEKNLVQKNCNEAECKLKVNKIHLKDKISFKERKIMLLGNNNKKMKGQVKD